MSKTVNTETRFEALTTGLDPYFPENTTVRLVKSNGNELWRVQAVMGDRQARDVSKYLRKGEFKRVS